MNMGPEFNEKLQWARYLQLQNDEERRKEKVRIARIEDERKKEEENKDLENKYMNYNVEEQEENPKNPKKPKKPKKPKDETDWPSVIFGVAYCGILIGILIFAIVKLVNGG